ncbi:MAG: iron-sulfur cluster assembly scaffold protein [Desulfobacteraceae bacterium]|nr:MAG: iron-sulfur cluster assembly scaffold protein [Desulfobacteraceae bacterium]
MNDKLDAFLDQLQEQIFDETREAFGEAGFDRWRHPRFLGKMENPHAYGKITGSCGDTMEMFLMFGNDRVTEASYTTDGCGSSSVCGSFAAEAALGKNPDELAAVTGETILGKLGRFPKEDEHCAYLASETLQEALKNYMVRQIKNRNNTGHV